MTKIADFIGIYDEKTKEAKRKVFKKKLSVLLDDISVEDKPELEMLLPEIAFCEVQLEELRAIITKEGPIARYDHGGGQSGTTKSPAITTYVSMAGAYLKLMKQFNALLSKARGNNQTGAGDELMKWIYQGKEAQ